MQSKTDRDTTKPFLKWPGGKMRLIEFLIAHLPQKPILVEPFVGAGALFANTTHRPVFINDINQDLINLYKQIKKSHSKFITHSQLFFQPSFNQKKTYYQLRDQFNSTTDPWLRAILFLYLNRHGYNGLCRYNLKGGYNVPFGEYKAPYFPLKEIRFFARRLKAAKISTLHFVDFLNRLTKHPDVKNMVVYCDPPYVPLSQTANFTGYAACKFTQQDQEMLADCAVELTKRGAKVMLSNHDTPMTRHLYKNAKIQTVQVQRAISCQGDSRVMVSELLAIYS